jgi:LemA protein
MEIVPAECVLVAGLSNTTLVVLVGFLLVLILLGLIGYSVGMRNNLVKMNNGIDKSFAEVDRLLKQRHDELPKLLETCKPYLEQEQKTLQSVAEARRVYVGATTPGQKAEADHLAKDALQALLAVATKNLELKRNTSFVQLQARMAQLEEKLAAQRHRYNEEVNSFNARIAVLPHAFAARLGKLQPREPFQANQAGQ